MDDLAFLRARIESYADYTNDDDRRLCDEQIRAYVGEALARLRERLRPSGSVGEELERIVLRCQFANQSVIRILGEATPTPPEIAQLHACDRELVTLADRDAALGAGEMTGFLADVDAGLDRRNRAITGAPAN